MNVTKPPMGFNVCNGLGEKCCEKAVLECVDALCDRGFRTAGYEYMIIDDWWSERKRDPKTGCIVPSHTLYPHGMKVIGDYVHSKGMKFGMYSCCGEATCGDFPGSYDNEYLDAKTFASWGVDYLKYDYCNRPAGVVGELLYRRMAMALKATGRDILFAACQWGRDKVWDWIRSAGAHTYRSTGDMWDGRVSMMRTYNSQRDKWDRSGPECFNDMDMLTVGLYNKGSVATGPIDYDDYVQEFGLWCFHSAPLIMGCDVRTVDEQCAALLKNRDLIRINQDSECRPPMQISRSQTPNHHVLAKRLDDGTFAIGLFNFEEEGKGQRFVVNFSDIGMPGYAGYDMVLRDILTGEEVTERDCM